MVNEPDTKDWLEYRRHILSELGRISGDLQKLSDKLDDFRRDEISQIKVDIAMLKVKAGAWGGLAALIVTLGALLLQMFSGR